MRQFTDYNRDGYVDFLQVSLPYWPSGQAAVQVVSGANGAVLWSTVSWSVNDVAYAGDVNGDNSPDIAILSQAGPSRFLDIWSPRTNTILWSQLGTVSAQYGAVMLGNIDVNADGRSEFLVATQNSTLSDVYVHDSSGALLHTVPCRSQNRIAYSMCNMGDMNGDGRHDFLIGCANASSTGTLVLVSGANGAVLRLSDGLAPGDFMIEHASNLGDIDGDGVNDYQGFPYIFSYTGRTVQYSGATGNVIRSWFAYGDSVIAGPDMDLDGIADVVVGSDGLVAPNTYGIVLAYSGRDGTELWRVQNFNAPPGSGGSNGTSGFARHAASLGVQPGKTYPTIAWMDLSYYTSLTIQGRVRAFNTERAGQGAITGRPCSSPGLRTPQIGARQTSTGARITIAKGPPGGIALLNLGLSPQTSYGGMQLPIDLGVFGMPGCMAYVGPDVHYVRALGTTGIDKGYAAVDLPFQLTASALGIPLVAQWLVSDPARLGYAATAMHALLGQ